MTWLIHDKIKSLHFIVGIKGYGKFERQITNVSNKAEVGNYQSVLYILENQKIEVISLENETKNDKLFF